MIGSQRGISIVEVLIAAGIIGIGLVGVMSAVPISGYGIYEGGHLTTATFLAEQKMEELKNTVWQATSPTIPAGVWPASPADCLGSSAGNGNVAPTSTQCYRTNPTVCAYNAACNVSPDEANVAGYTGYGRSVRILNCAAVAGGCGGVTDANLRRVIVTVTYRPLTGVGASAPTDVKPVILTMDVARR